MAQLGSRVNILGQCRGARLTDGRQSSVIEGLSSVGPPPVLMMIQLLASVTIVGS